MSKQQSIRMRWGAAGLLWLVSATAAVAGIQEARGLLQGQNYDAAVTELNATLADDPNNAEARFLKGLALASSGKNEAAVALFEKLVKDEPGMAEAWNNLGVLRARTGTMSGARAALQKAIAVDPEHAPAQENLGDIYIALARRAYSHAAELEPGNAAVQAKGRRLAGFLGRAPAPDPAPAQGNPSSEPVEVLEPPAVSDVAAAAPETETAQWGTPRSAVERWAEAWSRQDVSAYLAAYGNEFEPESGQSRRAWERERRERVGAPEQIQVKLSDVYVQREGDQTLVVFSQEYSSNSYSNQERKAILLNQTGDAWKIIREGSPASVFLGAAPAAEPPAPEPDPAVDPPGSEASEPPAEPDPVGPGTVARTEKTQAVRAALRAWAQAWSAQNLQAYFDAYSDRFDPEGGQSRRAWMRERNNRVTTPETIDIALSDIDVTWTSTDTVRLRFDQRYRSDSYRDQERKTVMMVREGTNWKITSES